MVYIRGVMLHPSLARLATVKNLCNIMPTWFIQKPKARARCRGLIAVLKYLLRAPAPRMLGQPRGLPLNFGPVEGDGQENLLMGSGGYHRGEDRTIWRWREQFETDEYSELADRLKARPSDKRVPVAVVEEVLCLYAKCTSIRTSVTSTKKLREDHGIELSYTWVQKALQWGGLVPRGRNRRKHRRRRERCPRGACCCTSTAADIAGIPRRGSAMSAGTTSS